MKYVTRALILIAIFGFSVWYMGQNLKEESSIFDTTVEMGETSFPLVSLLTDGHEVNMMHGYSGNINIDNFRDAVLPLDTNKTVNVLIRQQETTVKKLIYEITEVNSDNIITQGSISAMETTEEGKTAKLKLDGDFEAGREYSFKITLVTDTSKKIHYFSRIKQIDHPFIKEKLDFVMGFHKATFDSEKLEDYSIYLETNASLAPDGFSQVDIHSTKSQIAWENMKPEVLTKVVPTIKEVNGDGISVELTYLIKSSIYDKDGNEKVDESIYQVEEFYRMRYFTDVIYLLAFNRSMEEIQDFSQYDPTIQPEGKRYLTLGLQQNEELEVFHDTSNDKLCFVDHGTLWYAALQQNKIVKVLSFMDTSVEYYHSGYHQNNIKVLSIDSAGNINFIVYGYINKGDYEGRVGLILYKYFAEDDRIEEQAYIPMEQPYEILERELDNFYYLSDVDVFYFSIDGVIYSYNITTRSLDIIAEDVTTDSSLLSLDGKYMVWQESSNTKTNKKLKYLHLETGETFDITAPEGSSVRLVGAVDNNFVFGYAKSSNIHTTKDGTITVPMHELEIMDPMGKSLKTYTPKEGYVSRVTDKSNILVLTLVKKESDGYEEIGTDYIVSKIDDSTQSIYSYRSVVGNSNSGKEIGLMCIALPVEYNPGSLPVVDDTKNTIINEDTLVHIKTNDINELKYYAYGYGHVIDKYDTAAEAIGIANENMGTVIDTRNHIIWQRGETGMTSSLATISGINTGGGVDSIGACIGMVLSYNHIQISTAELSKSDKTIMELLEEHLSYSAVNLTGSKLDEVLYYVSNRRPVIAMKSSKNAVLITGYSQMSVSYYDPSEGRTITTSKETASTLFEKAGNVFISYVY